MLTADTITDDQIRELRDALYAVNQRTEGDRVSCDIALGIRGGDRQASRSRCAEILNARAK